MRVLLAIIAIMFSVVACAEEKGEAPLYQAGVHYEVLKSPVKTKDPNKIEVTEVFWYGCGHCFHFEPILHQWVQQQQSDVDFQQSPAIWRDDMEVHARAYYVAHALGILDKAHQPLFNALNLEKKRLDTESDLADFFVGLGVDREKFLKTYKSFGVTSQVKQASARARSYKITGTPEVIVDGKYRISSKMAGDQINMLKVADYLIAKIRAERS